MTARTSVAWLALCLALSAQSQTSDLLTKVRENVIRFQTVAPSIVAREDYQQTASYPSHRTPPVSRALISELVMVKLPGEGGWVSFRDVLEVDGRRLNDRERRLVDLLQSPSPDALQQAQARGYAEADSTADISGQDAASKLAIVLHLAGCGSGSDSKPGRALR